MVIWCNGAWCTFSRFSSLPRRKPPSARPCKWMRLRRLVFDASALAPSHCLCTTRSIASLPTLASFGLGPAVLLESSVLLDALAIRMPPSQRWLGQEWGEGAKGRKQCPSRRSREAIRRTPPSLRFSPRHSQAWGGRGPDDAQKFLSFDVLSFRKAIASENSTSKSGALLGSMLFFHCWYFFRAARPVAAARGWAQIKIWGAARFLRSLNISLHHHLCKPGVPMSGYMGGDLFGSRRVCCREASVKIRGCTLVVQLMFVVTTSPMSENAAHIACNRAGLARPRSNYCGHFGIAQGPPRLTGK